MDYLAVDEHSVRFPLIGLSDGTVRVIWRTGQCVVAYNSRDCILVIATRDGIQFRVMKRSPSAPHLFKCGLNESSYFSESMMVHHVSKFMPNVLWVLEGSWRMWMIMSDGSCCCVGLAVNRAAARHNRTGVGRITGFTGVVLTPGQPVKFIFEGSVLTESDSDSDEHDNDNKYADDGNAVFSMRVPMAKQIVFQHQLLDTLPHSDSILLHLPHDRYFVLRDGSQLSFCNALWSCLSDVLGAGLTFGCAVPQECNLLVDCDAHAARAVVNAVTCGTLGVERIEDMPSRESIDQVLDILLLSKSAVDKVWAAMTPNVLRLMSLADRTRPYSDHERKSVLKLIGAAARECITAIMAFHNARLGAEAFGLLESNLEDTAVVTCLGEDGIDPPVALVHDFVLNCSQIVRSRVSMQPDEERLVGVVKALSEDGCRVTYTFTKFSELTFSCNADQHPRLAETVLRTINCTNSELRVTPLPPGERITFDDLCNDIEEVVCACMKESVCEAQLYVVTKAVISASSEDLCEMDKLIILVACSMRAVGIVLETSSTVCRSDMHGCLSKSADFIPASKLCRADGVGKSARRSIP